MPGIEISALPAATSAQVTDVFPADQLPGPVTRKITIQQVLDLLTGTFVESVSGTTNRITSTGGVNPILDISTNYVGQTSITTLGTVTTGTWNATPIDLASFVSGNLAVTHLNSGTAASATTFWRGDGTWATPAGTGVTSVSGTLNRITSTGGTTPVIDISASYVGQTSITTLGTITTGTWNGTPIDLASFVSGNLAVTHLNSGTSASATTFWRGDGTWATPAGTGVSSISGTANQILANGTSGTPQTGSVTLTLPQNIATSSSPAFVNLTLTGASILDSNGNINLSFGHVSSAVNYLQMVNSSTTNTPSIQAMGSDTNVSIAMLSKGDGGVAFKTAAVSATPFQIYNGTASQHLTNFLFANTSNTRNVTFPDVTGTVLLNTSVVAPTIQKFLTGSGTYTTPTSPAPLYIRVSMVGGGSGGGASGTSPGSPVAGGNTTFGTTLLVANGGVAGNGGAGGTASLGSGPIGIALSGMTGGSAMQVANGSGSNGGISFFGGAGIGNQSGFGGGAASTNTGSGGGGAGGTASSGASYGGASGGYVDAIITSPLSTYSYAVGAGGAGATLGTGGSAGGAGAAGAIYVYEYYQ